MKTSFSSLRQFIPVTALLALALASSPVFTGCASGTQNQLNAPCATMKMQIEEKQALDEKVKKAAKEAAGLRKQSDSTAAAAADLRLSALVESQRLLKESLEASSRDCSPTMKDPEPVRDPASSRPENMR